MHIKSHLTLLRRAPKPYETFSLWARGGSGLCLSKFTKKDILRVGSPFLTSASSELASCLNEEGTKLLGILKVVLVHIGVLSDLCITLHVLNYVRCLFSWPNLYSVALPNQLEEN